MSRSVLRIGQLCERTGTTPRMLRHYERAGVLAPRRATNGYRYYDEEDVRTVEDLRCLLAAGLTLDESAAIIEAVCASPEHATAAERSAALNLIARRREHLTTRIDELTEIRARLDVLHAEVATTE